VRLADQLVDGGRRDADLVAAAGLDRLGAGPRLDREVAVGERAEAAAQRGEAAVVEAAQAVDQHGDRPGHAARHQVGERDRHEQCGDRDDQERATRGGRSGRGRVGLRVRLGGDDALELVVHHVEPLVDGDDLVGVGRARAHALLDAVHGLLARELERLAGARLELAQRALELRERRLAGRALDARLEPAQALRGLALEGSQLLRGPVLGLDVAILDVEVAHHEVARGEEVLADRDELLQRLHVALGGLPGAGVELAETAEADGPRHEEREHERPEGRAEAMREPQVVEARHHDSPPRV
jgi:hypothetical protein